MDCTNGDCVEKQTDIRNDCRRNMKIQRAIFATSALVLLLAAASIAEVKTDYDRNVDFVMPPIEPVFGRVPPSSRFRN